MNLFRPKTESPPPASNDRGRLWSLWIDGVGGFAIIRDSKATMGRIGCDLDVIGNVSRKAGSLVRRGEDWFWISDERKSSETCLFVATKVSQIPIGGSVDLTAKLPSPLSSTMRIDIAAPLRFDHSIDAAFVGQGIILLGTDGHISGGPISELDGGPVALICDDDQDDHQWRLRGAGIDAKLTPGTPFRFENLSLVIQPWVSSATAHPRATS